MAIIDGIRRQLRSVIEWDNPAPDDLFYRWSDNGDEIKNASKLIVNPGQGCIFVYEGSVEAVITNTGIVNLKTANVPFWTTIKKFMQFFESEHKVGLYYFKTTKILNQKWGTTSIIKYEDPKYQFPVGLKAYGNYSFKIVKPDFFFTTVVGAKDNYSVDQFKEVMNSRIIQPLTDYMAESKFSYAEIDAGREELSSGIHQKINSDFIKLGFEITDFRIEGTNFDENTEDRINRIADVMAEAQAAEKAGINYTEMQKLQAMRDAAKNEGGGAGVGMGLGAGIGFGQMLSESFKPQNNQPAQPGKEDPMIVLKKLKEMLDAELIEKEEYDQKKKEILDRM
ncbi:MAG: SPFH domain-containing protein [Deltaproteobacteria bacterium]|nr:SPFH domain-containing protein [Deltaproteobacteria bacterium]